MVDGLEVLDELLHHGLHHHAVLTLGLRPEQDSTASLYSTAATFNSVNRSSNLFFMSPTGNNRIEEDSKTFLIKL